MKWQAEDMPKYIQAKEYIDTAIIPLQPFHLTNEAKLEQDAFQRDILSIYASEIEKMLSGRVLLTPTYTYISEGNHLENEVERLNNWTNHLKEQPFQHMFALTLDNSWRKMNKVLEAELLWVPGMKNGNIRSEETITFIKNQVEEISELIRSYW